MPPAPEAPRTWLFVPAPRAGTLLAKAVAAGAEAIILDLEDAVGRDVKDDARSALAEALDGERPSIPLFVRVNARSTRWFADDLAVVGDLGVAGVVLPKCDGPSDVVDAAERLASAERPPGLVPIIETPLGLANVSAIATAHPSVVAIALGAEDLAVQVGFRRTVAGNEILHARSMVVLAARVAGVWAIDTPWVNFEREEDVRADAATSADLGFDGKLLIHPRQVVPTREAFTPSVDEQARAARVLASLEAMDAAGGVVAADGEVVDEPIVAWARSIVRRSR